MLGIYQVSNINYEICLAYSISTNIQTATPGMCCNSISN